MCHVSASCIVDGFRMIQGSLQVTRHVFEVSWGVGRPVAATENVLGPSGPIHKSFKKGFKAHHVLQTETTFACACVCVCVWTTILMWLTCMCMRMKIYTYMYTVYFYAHTSSGVGHKTPWPNVGGSKTHELFGLVMWPHQKDLESFSDLPRNSDTNDWLKIIQLAKTWELVVSLYTITSITMGGWLGVLLISRTCCLAEDQTDTGLKARCLGGWDRFRREGRGNWVDDCEWWLIMQNSDCD